VRRFAGAPPFAIRRRRDRRRRVRVFQRTRATGPSFRTRPIRWPTPSALSQPPAMLHLCGIMIGNADALACGRPVDSGARRGIAALGCYFLAAKPWCDRMTYGLARASIATATLVCFGTSGGRAHRRLAPGRLLHRRLASVNRSPGSHPVGRHGCVGGSRGASKGRWLVLGVPAGTFGWSGFGANDRFRFSRAGSGRRNDSCAGFAAGGSTSNPNRPALCNRFRFGRDARAAANAGDVGSDTNRLLFRGRV